MQVSVIILTKNQKELLRQSLPVLLNQKKIHDCEIIIVDSGSTDGAVEYIKTLPVKLVQIEPEKFSFPGSFNLGAKQATGEILIRLSGDAVPQNEDFIFEMISPFQKASVGGVFGRYVLSGRSGYELPNFWEPWTFPDSEVAYPAINGPSMGLRFSPNKNKTHQFLKLVLFAGGCCALRRKIWLIRPFNENLIAAEDPDYGFFLRLMGYEVVYNPRAVVIHEHSIVRNHPDKFSWLMHLGISRWQFLHFKELIKLYLDRFVFKKYNNLLFGK